MSITFEEAVSLLDEYGFIKQEKKNTKKLIYKGQYGHVMILTSRVYNGRMRCPIEAYHPEWDIRSKEYTVKNFRSLLKKMLEMDKVKHQALQDEAATIAAHKKSLEEMLASCEEAKKYPYTIKVNVIFELFIHAEIKVGKINIDLFPDSKGMVRIKIGTELIQVPLSKAIRIAEIMDE